jgi:hypothetical protein
MPGTDCLDKIAEVEYEMEMAIAGYGALRREAASQESA